MVKNTAIAHTNSILNAHSWGTAFGHSFHIGGSSFYLSQKIDLEIVCLTGCWRSLMYKVPTFACLSK